MLTEQNVIMELTGSSDAVVGFITTDDGHALLAVDEREDGTLEFMTTPITLMPQNNMVSPTLSPTLIKTTDGNFILHSPIFQMNVQGLSGTAMQQTNLLPRMQYLENRSGITEPLKVQDTNEYTVTEYLLPRDNSNVLSDKVQLTVDNHIKSKSTPVSNTVQNVYKRSPGRPKKNEVNSQNTQSLQCDICSQEFTKQTLYRKHMENHAEEKPHRCPKCPASFNIPTNFTLHMATHNTGDPKCPECGRKYARMASLKSHMLLHEKEENLFCTECEDAFSTKAQLDAHLKLHGEKWASEDVRKCKLCNKQFVQPALYRMHIREHYRTKIVKQTKRGTKHKTMYKCTICLKTFQKPSQLIRHIRIHTGEKPFECTVCNRAFTQKSSLQIHAWQHKGIRPHACSLCNAKFSQKGNLKAHILRVHNAPEGESTYACSYCSCVFKRLGSLNGHIKRMHSVSSEESSAKSLETNPISSEAEMRATVDSVISQLASLESVVNNTADSTRTTTLSAEQNDILQQALKNSGLPNKNDVVSNVVSKETAEPKKTDSSTSYVTLVDRTAGGTSRKYLTIKQRCVGNVRWYACSFCPKEFKKPSDLIRHLRVHTQEKPFKCMYCVRSFALKSTMIAHERTHTGVKKYACESCDKTFACHNSLTAHTKLHTKPHKCNICDKSFSASTILKNHMKSHTREKPKISPEAESLVPQVVLQEPLVISDDADNKISVAQVQSKQKQLYESVGVARPHECWVCHAAFRKVSHLKQHFRRHTGERPYKCSKCDRRFTSNSVLKSHLHTHDDTRPYSCSICDTKFSTQSSMKRHLVTHSNKRPYMCPYCHKTFKTYVNCRKHMKRHKHELAQQQLEEQKMQAQKDSQPTNEVKEATSALPESITLTEDMEVSFQPQMAPDFTQAFSDQFQNISTEKEKSFLSLPDNTTQSIVNQNLSVDTTNLGTSQTLHADETGTITLPNYSGDQTFTPESIREIEETLNQQLFNMGMNLGLGTNNLPRQMDEANTNSLDNSREQPVLNIIYEHNKSLESSGNTIFMSQFDSFDMNQITLQTDNDIDIGLNPSNSMSMSSILPRSVGSQQEEQQAVPITTTSNIDASQITKNTHLVVINPKENCSELVRLSQVCPSKHSKVIAKADTTNGSEMQGMNGHEKTSRTSNAESCENERNSFMKNFQSTISSEMLVSSGITDNSAKISQCNTLLQCHMCSDQGFTTERLKEHLKSHRGDKEYECSECSQRFCTNRGLSKHLKMHMNKQRWKCTICQKVLDSKLQMKYHSKMHTGTWNVSSVEPDSSQKNVISSSSGLPSNLTTLDVRADSNPSVSEKVLMAAVAEKKSMDRADEDIVKKEIREYTNKCKYCPKTFRKPSDLIRHIRTHTGERPYKCDHCSKSFAVKCTLDSHTKVHTGKKTFCCHVCSSLFATKGSLKVHMRLHTGSKPYKCLVCDLRFRTSGHKKVHMLKHAREHKGGAKRKPKHSKIAAVAEAAASLEKIGNSSLDNASTTTTTAIISDEAAPSQNLNYPALEQTVNLGTAVHLPNQIAFNHTDTTILNNNSILSVNENNELVANLQFLLANGLVTFQTDDTLLTQSTTNSSDATGAGMPTNMIELVNPDPFQEACNLGNANHVVITSQVPTETTIADTSNKAVIQMNNCMPPVSMVQIQAQDTNSVGVFEAKTRDQTTAKASTQPSSKECDVCGKTFMKPYQLERHKRIHTGEKPFKCEQCGKSFAQKFTLHLHQQHHTGDRPYSCPHCKRLFTQKCNLQTHLKRFHQTVMLDVKKLKSGQQMLGTLLQDNQGGGTKLLNLDDILVVDFLK